MLSQTVFFLAFAGLARGVEFPNLGYAAKILKFEQCKDLPGTGIKFRNMSINRVSKNDYQISGICDVTRDMPPSLHWSAKVVKCKDPNKPSSCEHFMDTKKGGDICKELKDHKSRAYDLLANKFQIPNPKCPLKKGVFVLKNDTFDATALISAASVDQAKLWKGDLYFLKEDDTPDSCVHFEAEIQKATRSKYGG